MELRPAESVSGRTCEAVSVASHDARPVAARTDGRTKLKYYDSRRVALKRGILLGAVAVAAAVAVFSSAARADDSSNAAGLSIGRILDTSNHGDVVVFPGADQNANALSGSASGLQFTLPLATSSTAPQLFGEISKPFDSSAAQPSFAAVDASVLGLKFKLFGAESSVSLENASPNLHAPGSTQFASQGPAVFAFYNFPQVGSGSTLGNTFGLAGQANGALAAEANATGRQDADAAATSFLAFPLVSSLSAQGPYWYGGYTPSLQGSSVQLSIPLRLAKFGVKVRLGEQSLTSMQPLSLANQILGPAFASASNYNSFNGGLTLALPLLNRRATVSLDGLYQTLQQTNGTAFDPSAFNQPSGIPMTQTAAGPIVLYPSSTDLQQYVGAASVAVPVTSRLTVKGSFSEQLAGSVDLNTLTQSLTQHTTAYAGGLVYNIPKSNSSINLFFNRNVYTDDAAPLSNWTENRQNLYFSVKF